MPSEGRGIRVLSLPAGISPLQRLFAETGAARQPLKMSVRVKICGITNGTDAQDAVNADADAIGFVFVPGTPRVMTVDQVRPIIARLPVSVRKVGLFVNATAPEIFDTLDRTGLDTVQLHGDESREFAAQFFGRVQVWKAFRIRDAAALDRVNPYFEVCDAILLDADVPGAHGGTGVRFDWTLADRIRALPKPVIIAGGLRPENVAEAVRLFAPWGVDVSSGVESAPGKKEIFKVQQFVRIAKSAVHPQSFARGSTLRHPA